MVVFIKEAKARKCRFSVVMLMLQNSLWEEIRRASPALNAFQDGVQN